MFAEAGVRGAAMRKSEEQGAVCAGHFTAETLRRRGNAEEEGKNQRNTRERRGSRDIRRCREVEFGKAAGRLR